MTPDRRIAENMNTKIPPDSPSDLASSKKQEPDAGESDSLAAYRKFLVPIDFSGHSKKTIAAATQLAALTGASIALLHVFQVPDYPAAFYQGLYTEHEQVKIHVDMLKSQANAQLALAIEQIVATGLEAQPLLRIGNPYDEIVQAAKEIGADLIVIGSHGHAGLERLLVGSTAERVVQYAPCPVLVVKNKGRKT
jgi:nucleotide-binding universal stress UspA family protein